MRLTKEHIATLNEGGHAAVMLTACLLEQQQLRLTSEESIIAREGTGIRWDEVIDGYVYTADCVREKIRRAKGAHASTRRRWRNSFKGTLKNESEKLHTRLEQDYKNTITAHTRRMETHYTSQQKQVDALCADVARIRATFGPGKFSNRFTLHAQFEDAFIRNSMNLPEHASLIFKNLVNNMIREFSLLDFARLKYLPDTASVDHRPVYEYHPKYGWFNEDEKPKE